MRVLCEDVQWKHSGEIFIDGKFCIIGEDHVLMLGGEFVGKRT